MPHSTNLTFDLVELPDLKWFNFSMRPTRSLSLGDGCRRDRVNRRVVERHMAASGVTAIDPEVRPRPVESEPPLNVYAMLSVHCPVEWSTLLGLALLVGAKVSAIFTTFNTTVRRRR
jgi:hypothetical protein